MTIDRATALLRRISEDSQTVNQLRPRRPRIRRPSEARRLSRFQPEIQPDDRRFLGPTPMERPPLEQWAPPGFELSNEQLFDIRERLHTPEGLPAAEWKALSPPIQQNILQVGRGKSEGIQRLVGDRVRAITQKAPPKETILPEWTQPIQELGTGLTELATYPIFTVGGVDVSAADIVGVVMLGYMGVQAGKMAVSQVAYRGSPLYRTLKDVGLKDSKLGPELNRVSQSFQKAGQNIPRYRQAVNEAFDIAERYKLAGTATEKRFVEPLFQHFRNLKAGVVPATAARPQPAAVRPPIIRTHAQRTVMEMGGLPAKETGKVLAKLPTEAATTLYKALQASAKAKGLDVQAIEGIQEGQYWVAISQRTGEAAKDAFFEWKISTPAEMQQLLETLGRGKQAPQVWPGQVAATEERTIAPGKLSFLPFENIEAAQKFIEQGDVTAVTRQITMAGEEWSPEKVQAAQQALTELPDPRALIGRPGGVTEAPTPAVPEAPAEAVAPEAQKGKRVRYQKGSVGDAVRAAKALKAEQDMYVYATASGMVIKKAPPPFGQAHIIVKPDGSEQVVSSGASFEAGRQAGVEPVVSEMPPAEPEPSPEAVTEAVAAVPPAPPSMEVPPEAPPLAPGEPPSPPEPPVVPELAGESVPDVIGESLPPLQDAATVFEIMFKPDASRALANLPMVRNLMPFFNPASIANDPWHQFVIMRAALYDEASHKSKTIFAQLRAKGTLRDVYGRLDPLGRIKEGPLKGERPGDVMSRAGRYKDVLTDRQKEWDALYKKLNDAKLAYLKESGIEIHELIIEEGGQFVGRKVYGQMVNDEVVQMGYVGAGPGRPGAKLGLEKTRFFETEKDAVDAGFRELNPDEVLYLNILGAYRRVADKQAADWFFTKVPWRTTGADPELIAAAQKANRAYRSAQSLKAALNRAVRGERIPDPLIKSIRNFFPSQAQELRDLIPRIQAGETTADAVQSLDQQAKGLIDVYKMDRLQTENARARSRARQAQVHGGEAKVQAAAFARGILTGPQALEAGKMLNAQFAPKDLKALRAINNANAVARYLVLAQDFSVLFIQGLFMMGENPRIWAQSFVEGTLQAMADPSFGDKHLAANQELYLRHPTLIVPTGGSIEATEAFGQGGWMGPGPVTRPATEESLKAALVKTPFRAVRKGARTLLEPFQRGMEGFLLVGGTELAKSYEHTATSATETAELDQWMNEFRGLTSSARIGVSSAKRLGETLGLMAPRYFRSMASLLYDALKGAASFGQSGIRNRRAIIGLSRGVAAVSAIVLAAALALGERDPKKLAKHITPGDPEFWTVTIPDPENPEAGTRIGPGGKFRSVVNLIGDAVENPDRLLEFSMENPLLRAARGQTSFVTGSTIDILTGKTFIGDPTTDSWQNFATEIVLKNMMPIWLESTLFEGGGGRERTLRAAGEIAGWRTYPEPLYNVVKKLRDTYSKGDYGKPYGDLRDAERDKLRRKHPDLTDMETRSELEGAKYGTEFDAYVDAGKEMAITDRNTSLEAYAQAVLDGRITKREYDDNRTRIRAEYSGAKSMLWFTREVLDPDAVKDIETWIAENQHPDDKAMDEYYAYRAGLIEKNEAELPIGWDVIEHQMELFLERYPKQTQNYIVTRKDDWIKDLPPAARQVEEMRLLGIETGAWWNDYRGATRRRTSSGIRRPSQARALAGK